VRLCLAITALLLPVLSACKSRPETPETPQTPETHPCEPLDLTKPMGGDYVLTPVFTGTAPGALERATDMRVLHDGRAFVTTQRGVVLGASEVSEEAELEVWLDLTDRVQGPRGCCNEEGLLSLAFHPNFASNGQVFFLYSRSTGLPTSTTTLSRMVVAEPATGAPDPAGEEVLLELPQPNEVHNGGQVLFGRDGYLYVSMGDGGAGGDPNRHGQNKATLFGSILRIDVDRAEEERDYGIPPDNPFVDDPEAAPEIFAYGFRNPWRIAFDPFTDDLWAGDVGEVTFEEIDIVVPGGNYGWSNLEGHRCIRPEEAGGCDPPGYVPPVYTYGRDLGQAVIVGGVYDGAAHPSLRGALLFADFVFGTVWQLTGDQGSGYEASLLLETGMRIPTFGFDADGEAYLFDLDGGTVHRLDPGDGAGPAWATTLTETGCFADVPAHAFTDEVVPYEVNVPLWSDGADKTRGVVLPEGAQLAPDDDPYAAWQLPGGSVAIKTFTRQGAPLETRFLVKYSEEHWIGATYQWNDDATEAFLLDDRQISDQPAWIFPGRGDCLSCHTHAAGQVLGLTSAQLNRAGQLRSFSDLDLLAGELDARDLPAMPALDDDSAPLADRARGYLDVNCANCHRPAGPTQLGLDLRYATPLAETNACDADPSRGDLGLADARILAPGSAEQSILVRRMETVDPEILMPPRARRTSDDAAVAVITDWIDGLAGCTD
jgi:uncharacterized repeat protein (TIGR03806 family)